MALPEPGVFSSRVPTCCTVVCTHSPTCVGGPFAAAAGCVAGAGAGGGDAWAWPAPALDDDEPLCPQAARARADIAASVAIDWLRITGASLIGRAYRVFHFRHGRLVRATHEHRAA